MEVIKARDIYFGYGTKEILKGINITLNKSEMAFLIGPNGAGKSTLLSCLSGYLTPNKGEIILGGTSLFRLEAKDKAKKIGWLPQGVYSSFGFTVKETIAMGIESRKSGIGTLNKGEEQKVNSVIKDLGLEHLADREVNSLSYGERQKCFIASVLISDTQVILLDEPTSGLDPHQSVFVFEYINSIANKGKSVLTVSHDINIACIFADTIHIMKDGRILASGKPEEIITSKYMNIVYGKGITIGSHPDSRIPVILPKRIKKGGYS